MLSIAMIIRVSSVLLPPLSRELRYQGTYKIVDGCGTDGVDEAGGDLNEENDDYDGCHRGGARGSDV